ncbi:MAG TPA: biopolymer transporter ExbD [Bdellovibrionota bacterium]|nr:biopolymer transporter ExbD [Bdellovibrionota bacterium]
MTPAKQKTEEHFAHAWRARLKKRRGKTFNPVQIRELNLVAMMDMLTLILVFLLKSYSVSAMSIPVGEEINIPKSTNLMSPGEAVKLTVTKIGGETAGIIAVDEKKVMELSTAALTKMENSARQRNFLIPELHKELKQKADAIKQMATINPSVKFEGKILVIADKELPYWLVTEVLFTAAEAQFEQYKLVALAEKQ